MHQEFRVFHAFQVFQPAASRVRIGSRIGQTRVRGLRTVAPRSDLKNPVHPDLIFQNLMQFDEIFGRAVKTA
jgi:hypothetical protein